MLVVFKISASTIKEKLNLKSEIEDIAEEFCTLVWKLYGQIKKDELMPILNEIFADEELALEKIEAICKLYYS
jgi:hypothetical protein